MIVVKELEPDLPDSTVTWNSNLNIISFPHFRPPAHEEPVVVMLSQQQGGMKQSKDRRKFHKKVKTSSSSTQTEPQLSASRPGMHYMETSPGKELIDSFSSLPSIDCTMEQLSLQQQVTPQEQVMPQQHKEQANNLINSLTMETARKHLTGKNTQHGDRKKQKNKKKLKVDKEITYRNVSLSSIAHAKLTDHERLKSNTLLQSTPVHVPSTAHCIVTHTPAVTRQLQHSSLNLTSTPSSDTVMHNVQQQSHPSGDTVMHHTQEQPHSSDTMTYNTHKQPHSSDIVTCYTREQPHSSDIMTHHTQVEPHSSDIVTHHTQVQQPHSSDIVTHHTQEQSHIIQQVKRWSKFEQLKAKYLPQSTHSSVISDNHKILHSRFFAKQKLN